MLAAIGLDLGGTNMAAGVLTADRRLLYAVRRPTAAQAGPAAVLGRMADLLRTLLEQARADGLSVAGIGLGLPGLLDTRQGISVFSPNTGWRDVPVAEPIRRALGLPVYLDNDVRAHTRGEWHLGAGRGVDHFILITLGTGIGSGIVLRGELYSGPTESAGEVGHQTLVPDGHLCGCGNHGCLETLAAGPGIARSARAVLAGPDGPASRLWPLYSVDPNGLTAADVGAAAAAGDSLAMGVLAEAGRWLGIGLANVINILNPDLVIIGGGVAAAGELLLGPARREVAARAMPVPRRHVRIVPAALGRDAGPIGAATLVPELREELMA